MTAARYLQTSPGQDVVQLANQFQALRGRFKGDIALLSDDPQGTVEAGLPPGRVRAGVLQVGSTTADVVLVRVNDPEAGKIWLVSKETLARIPELYSQLESQGPTVAERIVPAALNWQAAAGHVTGTMARLVALDPHLLVAGLVVGACA